MANIEDDYQKLYPLYAIERPHVEMSYNPDALRGQASESEKVIGMIGSADNGKPNTLYKVTSLLQAKQIFGSGELVDALELAWSDDALGGSIYAMRVEDATPASLVAGGLTFNSQVYGDNSNKTQVALERNPINNSYRVTVDYEPDSYRQVYDNLGQIFNISYTPNDASKAKATYSVEKAEDGTAKKFILDITDAKEKVTTTTTLKPDDTTTTTTLAPTTTTTTTSTTKKPTTTTTTSTSTSTTTSTTTKKVSATSIKFDTNVATVKTGDDVQLSWKVLPEGADDTGITFKSDAPTIATVDDKGKVTSLKDGTANITISLGSLTDAVKLTIGSDQTTDFNGKGQNLDVANFAVEDDDLINIHQVFDLTSSDYGTVFELMNSLSLIPGITIAFSNSSDNSTTNTAILDAAEGVNIITDINDVDTATSVWAVMGDIVNRLQYDSYVSVVANLSKETPDTFGLTPMIGGSTGVTPISWAKKFKPFAQVPVYYMVALTQSGAVQAELKAFMNDQYSSGHSMRGFVGAGYNEADGQLLSRRLALKEARLALIGSSGYKNMKDGRTLHLPGYMLAAYAAGVASGLQIGGALTNKYIDLVSIDQDFNSAQLDRLNSQGVIIIEPVMNRGNAAGFRFIQDVTTNNSTNEPVKSRISLGELTDFLFDDLRFELEKRFVGANIRQTSKDQIKNFVDSYLYKQKLDTTGLVVDYDPDDIQVRLDADIAWIMFTVKPSQTLDKILVYGAYQNFTDSTSTNNGSDATNSSNTSILNSSNPDINAGYEFSNGATDTITHDSSNGIYN